MQQFKVTFYIRKTRALSDGSLPIYTRLTLNHSRIELGSTGFSTTEKEWDPIKGRAKGKTAVSRALNNNLDGLASDLNQVFRRLEFNENLSLGLIKQTYLDSLAKPAAHSSFMTFYKEYLAEFKLQVGVTRDEATYSRYHLCCELFGEFLRMRYHRQDISFAELNYSVIHDYEQYLLNAKGYSNHNTLMKKMRCLKSATLMAQRMGKLDHDPFVGYKIHYIPVDRGFLTDEELKLLMTKNFRSARLEHVRDLFLFSCFTGLAYVDVSKLTKDNLVMLDGKMWIMTNRQKTDVPTNILLLDIPKRIIEKYDGLAADGKLLPIISNQKINEFLKEIAELCGINRKLTYHLARHTFATMSLSKGVPMETVSKMLGHTNIRTTMIYARVTNKKVEQVMMALSEKLNGFEDVINDSESHVLAKKQKKQHINAFLASLNNGKTSKRRGCPTNKTKVS